MKWPKKFYEEGNKIINNIDFKISTPSKENVLRFMTINPSKIKIVIIGQDPYPTKGVANGFAFAVNKGSKIPQSLKNIFKEILEVNGFVNTDETLLHWANQGVLLLNRALTTEIGKPNAHAKLWDDFTKNVIVWINENIKPTWVLWGREAQKIKSFINGEIIFDAHPSPLSVRHRTKETFKKIKKINW